MSKYKEPESRDTILVRKSLDELVSKDNEVRIIDVLVDRIVEDNPEKFKKKEESPYGASRYPESLFLKLYLYGYMNRIKSSRSLEKETHRNIEVKWLLGNLQPDHWTISGYRKEHSDEIKFLCRAMRMFLKENDYIKTEEFALDGTKVKANAKRGMLTDWKIRKMILRKLSAIEKRMDIYLKNISEMDEAEALEEELDRLESEGVNRKLLDKISSMEEEIHRLEKEKEAMERREIKAISPTDKDSRLMNTTDGLMASYNVQVLTDKNHMIVDSEVNSMPNDSHQIPGMLQSLKEEIGILPKVLSTDKGYYVPEVIKKSEAEYGVEIFTTVVTGLKKDKNGISFVYDKEKDEFICSEGKRLILVQKNKQRGLSSYSDVYRGVECSQCRLKDLCTKSDKGRILNRNLNQDWIDVYRKKMNSPRARVHLRRRKEIIEHTFGTMKLWMGKIPLLLRGLKKVSTEINIYSSSYVLKRLLNMEDFDFLFDRIQGFNWKMA